MAADGAHHVIPGSMMFVREKRFHVSHKVIMIPFPQDSTNAHPVSEGHTPVCRGHSLIYHAESGDTPCTVGNINS